MVYWETDVLIYGVLIRGCTDIWCMATLVYSYMVYCYTDVLIHGVLLHWYTDIWCTGTLVY